MPGFIRPWFCPYWVPPYNLSDFGRLGVRHVFHQLCQNFIRRHRSEPYSSRCALGLGRLVCGTSFSCLPSLWQQLRLRPALNPLWSAKSLNHPPPADRRRWTPIERHHRQRGAWRSRKSIPRSRQARMQPTDRLRRMELPASTQKEPRPRAATSSIRTN